MKTYILSALLASIGLLFSCTETVIGPEGPPGPRGPQGFDGVDGEDGMDAEESYIFEWINVNFTAPDYEVILPYEDFAGRESDVALVYLLWGVDEDTGLEIWRPVPQTVLFPQGMLIYNYDFTLSDVRLFLDATFPLDELGAIDTDDWVVRVVVVPGDFWDAGRVDVSNYYNVIEMLGVSDLKSARQTTIERR